MEKMKLRIKINLIKIERRLMSNKSLKNNLVDCVKSLYLLGHTSAISGNQSIRFHEKWMWITPSGIPRYNLKETQLVKVDLKTGKIYGKLKPSIEWQLHQAIYNKQNDVNAIIHTHGPYTIGISISTNFLHVIEESKAVVGDPIILEHFTAGSEQLAKKVSESFVEGKKAVIIKNHGVVTIGKNIDEARAVAESLEEWAKILTIAKVFGGPKNFLNSK